MDMFSAWGQHRRFRVPHHGIIAEIAWNGARLFSWEYKSPIHRLLRITATIILAAVSMIC